jgi:hypothetical protein
MQRTKVTKVGSVLHASATSALQSEEDQCFVCSFTPYIAAESCLRRASSEPHLVLDTCLGFSHTVITKHDPNHLGLL